jgi:hypothetical protein
LIEDGGPLGVAVGATFPMVAEVAYECDTWLSLTIRVTV